MLTTDQNVIGNNSFYYYWVHAICFAQGISLTRFKNNHASAADSIFVDISRSHSYTIVPLTNGLPDYDVQCLILNKIFVKTKVINVKLKNKLKSRLITRDTISCFQELLSKET